MEKVMNIPGVFCTGCGAAYQTEGLPYQCPLCGGFYDYKEIFHFDPQLVDLIQPGIWRFQHTFCLPKNLEPVSLGEGNTPLIRASAFSRQVAFKCEFLNPSGSFKDRGSTIIASWLKYNGVTNAIEDSSGNAGASLAAYAARAGINTRIFVPETASGPKRRQIEAYGAKLVPIPGSRAAVTDKTRLAAKGGAVYASHACLPFNLPGYATISYEIVEQLGKMPGAVIVPAGQGGLLLGLARGFDALRIGNLKEIGPMIIGVQAAACAPLAIALKNGTNEPGVLEEHTTLAEGVRTSDPLRKDAVLEAVRTSGGTIFITEEEEILPGRDELSKLGLYVEPTSAIVWAALAKMVNKLPDPIVVILTGSGLKYG
jgi:threonine synthase